jgi:hypothetical protein
MEIGIPAESDPNTLLNSSPGLVSRRLDVRLCLNHDVGEGYRTARIRSIVSYRYVQFLIASTTTSVLESCLQRGRLVGRCDSFTEKNSERVTSQGKASPGPEGAPSADRAVWTSLVVVAWREESAAPSGCGSGTKSPHGLNPIIPAGPSVLFAMLL